MARYTGEIIGPSDTVIQVSRIATPNTTTMATINNCVAFRFTAVNTRDVKSVYVNYSSVSAAGTIQLRIETVDATTRKPTGTLYDANATKDFTPVAGWQNVAFTTLPTTGLTADTEYAVVLLTTGTGTTQTLRSFWALSTSGLLPAVMLTATDGSTRSNLAETNNSQPVCTIVFEDDAEESYQYGFSPFGSTSVAETIYGTRGYGVLFETYGTLSVHGAYCPFVLRNGNPENWRFRIFSGNSAVSGATKTIDKNSLANLHTRGAHFWFPSPVSLTAGSYRAIFDQTDHATTSGNNYGLRIPVARSASVVPSGFVQSHTSDIDAGTITWVEDATQYVPIQLYISDGSVPSGGGMLVHPGMSGGCRG